MSVRQMELFADFDCYQSITGDWITSCRYCAKTKRISDPDDQALIWLVHLQDCPQKKMWEA